MTILSFFQELKSAIDCAVNSKLVFAVCFVFVFLPTFRSFLRLWRNRGD